MNNKIVLLGYMGVGKTTTGKSLAKKMNLVHFDLDNLIEKQEKETINQLFYKKGELYFRKIEHQLFQELLKNKDNFVLSVGGGTPCYYNNYLLLEDENIISVYLEASLQMIYDRLVEERQQRPFVKDLNPIELKEFIGKHLFERSFYYQKANYKVKVDGKNVTEICNEILEFYSK